MQLHFSHREIKGQLLFHYQAVTYRITENILHTYKLTVYVFLQGMDQQHDLLGVVYRTFTHILSFCSSFFLLLSHSAVVFCNANKKKVYHYAFWPI